MIGQRSVGPPAGSASRKPRRLRRRLAVAGAGAALGLFAGAGVARAQPAYTQVAGSPFATGAGPLSLAFSPGGELLATADGSIHSASTFSVAASGALSAAPGSPFQTGRSPASVAFSPGGGLLATANSSSQVPSVSVFSVAGTGALSPAPGSPFATGGDVPVSVAFSPDGELLATANFNTNTVSVFTVARNGVLRPVSGSPFTVGGSAPYSVAFSPDGDLLATANFNDSTVSVLTVAPTGALTPVRGSPFAAGGTSPKAVAFSPSGRLLATANYGSDSVSVFDVGVSGTLGRVHGSPFATGGSIPNAVAFDPSGELLATANMFGNSASVFSVAATGALNPVDGSPFATGSFPASVAFSPGGGLFATANNVGSSVSMFAPTGGLEIRTASSRKVIAQGKVLSYTLTLRPAGSSGASGPVTDDLSGVLDSASYSNDARASTGTVSFDPASGQLVWSGTLAPGQEATVTYSVTIDGSANGLVQNAVVGPPGSRCPLPSLPEPPCTTRTLIIAPPARGADMALAKIPSATTAHPGSQVSFVLAVHNYGPRRATRARVDDPLPTGLFAQSALTSQGSCTVAARDVDCRLGTVSSGGGALVLVRATVAGNASGTLVNEASVTARRRDPNHANNVARASIAIAPLTKPAPDPGTQPVADLVVSKTVSSRAVLIGRPLTYKITVTNISPTAATNVRHVSAFKLPLTVTSVHASQGTCTQRQPIQCNLGTLAAHSQATITIKGLAAVAGAQVGAAAATSSSWDRGQRSNLALARTTVIPVLSLLNTASNTVTPAGAFVTFTLRTANNNGITLKQVRTCGALPAGLVYLSATPKPQLSSGRYCWTAASLANGKSKTYQITARVPLGATGTATSMATATGDGSPVSTAKATIQIVNPVACPASGRHPPPARIAC